MQRYCSCRAVFLRPLPRSQQLLRSHDMMHLRDRNSIITHSLACASTNWITIYEAAVPWGRRGKQEWRRVMSWHGLYCLQRYRADPTIPSNPLNALASHLVSPPPRAAARCEHSAHSESMPCSTTKRRAISVTCLFIARFCTTVNPLTVSARAAAANHYPRQRSRVCTTAEGFASKLGTRPAVQPQVFNSKHRMLDLCRLLR